MICRWGKYDRRPCPFNPVCEQIVGDTRRKMQSAAELWGTDCWAYEGIAEKRPELLRGIVVDQEGAV